MTDQRCLTSAITRRNALTAAPSSSLNCKHSRYQHKCYYNVNFDFLNFVLPGTAIAGKNVANPIAMINASIDMLEHLGHHFHADLMRRAVHQTLNVDR
jgi:hypothetical protein